MKVSDRIERFLTGDASPIEMSRPNRDRRVSSVLPLCLLSFFVLFVGCGIHDPGQRDWTLNPILDRDDRQDASSDDADLYDTATDEGDAQDGNRADVDARTPDAEKDSCIATDEVCDNEDNNCDGETDGPEASENCKLDNAEAVCESGQCVIEKCEPLYGNCNDDPEDGCEKQLKEIENCGECDVVCEIENGTATCDSGICKVDSCDEQFADCNDDPEDGCEASLVSPKYCGECDNACPEPEIGSDSIYVCDDGECSSIDCESGFANCDDDPETGCDTDILNSVEHCGGCGQVCNSLTADRCIDGSCYCGDYGGSCTLPEVCCPSGFCRVSC